MDRKIQSRNGLAREAYLDGLPAQEQAETLRQAERLGVRPDDPDWIIARAAQQAAERIEGLSKSTQAVTSGTTLGPDVLAAIEAAVRGVPLSAELCARLERIEERMGQMPTARMIEPLLGRAWNDEPSVAASARDLGVFALALLACVAVLVVAVGPWLRSPILLISVFALGWTTALGYLWLQPNVAAVIERWRKKRG